MATAASQPYIAKLGFQDKDRANERHGLACEYLLERLIQLEVTPSVPRGTMKCGVFDERHRTWGTGSYEVPPADTQRFTAESISCVRAQPRINVSISSGRFVAGFADVLIEWPSFHVYGARCFPDAEATFRIDRQHDLRNVLGEVKIAREPAEIVLQQLNYYRSHLGPIDTYVLTDYDPAPLKRLVEGTNIKVFRLGDRFERWITERRLPTVEEL